VRRKLYAVAGKTSAGPWTTLYIHDPSTDARATGPKPPRPAAENTAVAELGGKLHVFGDSTKLSSSAITKAEIHTVPSSSCWEISYVLEPPDFQGIPFPNNSVSMEGSGTHPDPTGLREEIFCVRRDARAS
jgi:hypothetical protein